MLTKFILSIDFEFSNIDNRKMSVVLKTNKETLIINEQGIIKIEIQLPSLVTLIFSGKNQETDTLMDSQGNILQDVHVKIKSIRIDGLEIPEWSIQKKITLETDTGMLVSSSYIGFNGTMRIDMPEIDIFSLYQRFISP